MPNSPPDLADPAQAQAWDRGSNTALRAIWLATLLGQRIPPGTEVLEVGARTGLIGAELTRIGLRACGVESSAEFARVAADKKLFPIVIASADRLPFAYGRFRGRFHLACGVRAPRASAGGDKPGAWPRR